MQHSYEKERKKKTKTTEKISVNINWTGCKYFEVLIELYYENEGEMWGLKYLNNVKYVLKEWLVFIFFKYVALQTKSPGFASLTEGEFYLNKKGGIGRT